MNREDERKIVPPGGAPTSREADGPEIFDASASPDDEAAPGFENIAVRGLNWNLLRTFCAVVETGSVTRAAERLGISQPSVSQAIRRLEGTLGCTLIARRSGRLAPTVRGARIHVEAAEMLRCAQRIEALARRPAQGRTGNLTLHIVSDLETPLIDEALRLFHQRHPGVALRVQVDGSSAIIEALREHGGAVGFCPIPASLTGPAGAPQPGLLSGLASRRLYSEECALYCGAEHPLFGMTDVPLRVLAAEPFVALSAGDTDSGSDVAGPTAPLRESLGLGERIGGASAHLDEARRMIIAGIGVGILPRRAAAAFEARGQLWRLDIGDRVLDVDIYMLRNAYAGQEPLVQEFWAVVEELLPLLPDLI